MADKAKSLRDAFGFSLRGLKASAAVAAGMAIGDDGINASWNEKLRRNQEERDQLAAKSG